MSLEIELQKNTEAALALTAAIAALSLTQAAPKAAKAKAEKTEKVEAPAATPAPEPVSTTDADPAVEPVSTTEAAPAAEASPMPTLAHLQAEGKKLMDAGQQALLKSIVLANGGTKLSLLPESGYRATLKALKAAVAAL
jgi:hypothetical protein